MTNTNKDTKKPIKYEDIERHHSRIEPDLKKLLGDIEDALIKKRDEDNVPVYLTKWRIKTVPSIFLKTKRKPKDTLEEYTDYAGLRILCMFEQDIFEVHNELLNIFNLNTLNNRYELKEFEIYGWEDDGHIKILQKAVESKIPEFPIDREKKKSGYKSIHYVVYSQKYENFVEIQLRTLLQDVWAEVEHKLAYKQGNTHPHVAQSFRLFARDIQTHDMLLAHLRGISDREKSIEQFVSQQAKPLDPLVYEEHLLPDTFSNNNALQQAIQSYNRHVCCSRRPVDENGSKAWLEPCLSG